MCNVQPHCVLMNSNLNIIEIFLIGGRVRGWVECDGRGEELLEG